MRMKPAVNDHGEGPADGAGRSPNGAALRAAAIALFTHLLFVSASLVPAWRAEPLMFGDTVTYVMPAENLRLHGAFSREQTGPLLWEPHRTPGYPLILAASLALTGGLAAALFVACATAGVAAWSVVRLASEWGAPPRAGLIGALVLAVLPNSLGLSARVLTDALFGHLFVLWLYLAWVGLRRASMPALLGSAAVLVALQSLKPSGNALWLLVPVLAVATGRVTRRKLAGAALVVALAMPVPLYFSLRNWQDHQVFSPSLLDLETVREYCQMRFLAREQGVSELEMTLAIRERDRAEAAKLERPASVYGRLYAVKRAEVRQFVRERPLTFVGLVGSEMIRQFAAPQEFAQQVLLGTLTRLGRAAGALLTLVLFGLAAVGGYVLWRTSGPGPAVAASAILGLFLALGSLSHGVGGRLRFPADAAVMPLVGAGLSAVRVRRGGTSEAPAVSGGPSAAAPRDAQK